MVRGEGLSQVRTKGYHCLVLHLIPRLIRGDLVSIVDEFYCSLYLLETAFDGLDGGRVLCRILWVFVVETNALLAERIDVGEDPKWVGRCHGWMFLEYGIVYSNADGGVDGSVYDELSWGTWGGFAVLTRVMSTLERLGPIILL